MTDMSSLIIDRKVPEQLGHYRRERIKKEYYYGMIFFSDLLWSRFVSRTIYIYLMLPTSIVFCLRLFSLSSRTIPFPQCRLSPVFFCVLSDVFYPLSFPPKLVAACMPSWRNTCSSQLCSLCCIVLKMDFSSQILFQTSSFVIFSVWLIFCILLHSPFDKHLNFDQHISNVGSSSNYHIRALAIFALFLTQTLPRPSPVLLSVPD